MQLFEVYNAKYTWMNCDDTRPWIVVDMSIAQDGLIGCFPLSGQCYYGDCFLVEQRHDDFPYTGLSKSCYVHDQRVLDLPFECFSLKRGDFRNNLLLDFRRYSGI